ncbi:MAG TPA: ribosome biogenesis GTP-binding protein YihA/YsxC [Gemmatimonadaceae bacterium]|nr:ribosome biogenesis GTP-binding protein YihA/YsxC [Gemmatimonadaceae bacterium]
MARVSEGASAVSDAMVVRSVEFLGGMATAGGWRPRPALPEVALSGRSNVGKSSLLNRLVQRRGVARVSQRPGKTREINFFAINQAFVLVDLPGYGFARASKTMRHAWRALVEGYVAESEELRGIVQLIDARHPPTDDDLQMMEFLSEIGAPVLVAATKVDKLPAREVADRVNALAPALGVPEDQVVPFSAITGAGRDELLAALVELVQLPPWRSA